MINCFAFRAAAVFLLLTLSIAGAQNAVVVTKDIARVLLLPYGDAKLVGIAKKGERYKVLTKKNDWYQVEFKGGIGWIFQANVSGTQLGEPVPSQSPPSSPPSSSSSQVQQAPQLPKQQQNMPQAQQVPAQIKPQQPVPQAPSAQPKPQQAPQQAQLPPVKQPPVQQKPAYTPALEPVKASAVQHGEEKQQVTAEQSQKKVQHKQKKPQNVSVDLPPAAVTPIAGSKELPTYSPESAAAPESHPQPAEEPQAAPPPSVKQPAAKMETVSPVVQEKPAPAAEAASTGQGQKYFEVTESTVKILASVSPESPILGMAHKNECYPLLYAGASWCKIQFGSSPGWIELRCGKIVDTPSVTKSVSRIVIFSAVGGAGLLLVVVLIIVLVTSLRGKAARKVAVKKDLLIIAQSEKEIQYSLTDTMITMSKCFSEIGFHISYASDFEHAKNLIAHYLPDVIVVDWQLKTNALSTVESFLSDRTSTSNILVIFYNVPDSQVQPLRKELPNVHFLGILFSDRDIFKLVTPLIITETETKSIRKSVETSALGGDIGHGSLIEVMQFIEIGRKTGCLYTVIDKPFGLIYFEQGRLTYAATQTRQGRDAVFEMLNLKKGHFHFVLDKTSQTKNVDLSTLEILMEWTKTVDEAHRS
jgi:hypothetical protein